MGNRERLDCLHINGLNGGCKGDLLFHLCGSCIRQCDAMHQLLVCQPVCMSLIYPNWCVAWLLAIHGTKAVDSHDCVSALEGSTKRGDPKNKLQRMICHARLLRLKGGNLKAAISIKASQMGKRKHTNHLKDRPALGTWLAIFEAEALYQSGGGSSVGDICHACMNCNC